MNLFELGGSESTMAYAQQLVLEDDVKVTLRSGSSGAPGRRATVNEVQVFAAQYVTQELRDDARTTLFLLIINIVEPYAYPVEWPKEREVETALCAI